MLRVLLLNPTPADWRAIQDRLKIENLECEIIQLQSYEDAMSSIPATAPWIAITDAVIAYSKNVQKSDGVRDFLKDSKAKNLQGRVILYPTFDTWGLEPDKFDAYFHAIDYDKLIKKTLDFAKELQS